MLLLVAGLLALIHLLTVQPYLLVSREIASIQTQLDSSDALLARLNPEIERLQTAEKEVREKITEILNRATRRMVYYFKKLRSLVKQVSSTQVSISALTHQFDPKDPIPIQHQQDQRQWTGPTVEQQQMQIQRPPLEEDPLQRRLKDIFETIRAGSPDAYKRLTEYAKSAIVEPAYTSANAEWISTVQPEYLEVLADVEQTARSLAESAPPNATEEANALRSAADNLATAGQTLTAIEISPDRHITDELGTEWWYTVEGKEQFADAIALSIEQRMREITKTSSAPAAAIKEIRQRQDDLRSALMEQRKALESQFQSQSKQLANLSGTSGAIPVDLRTFIGTFPLVRGLVFGLLMLRVGQARHDAARSAIELAVAAPEDYDTRQWLTRRVLGGSRARGPLLLTLLLALGGCAWIILAATQLNESPVPQSISVTTAIPIGIFSVLAAAAWDMWAILLLNRTLKTKMGEQTTEL